MSIPNDHDVHADDVLTNHIHTNDMHTNYKVHRSQENSPPPEASDHGAWDGPTVASAPDDAVRGGITSVARGVGAGLGRGVNMLRKAGSALGGGRGAGRGQRQH